MLTTFYRHWLDSFRGIPSGVWLLAFVNLINRSGSMVLVFLSVYLTQYLGFDIRDAGYVMTSFGLGALGGMWLGGWATDRFGFYPIQLMSLAFNGVMLLVLLVVTDFWTLCATIFLLSLISEMFRPANQVAIAYYSTPETRTRSISMQRMAFNLGFTLSPALGGILAGKFGWHWLFWADGLTCISAAVALRMLLKPGKIPQQPEEKAAVQDSSRIAPWRDKPYLAFTIFTFLGALVFMQLIWTIPVFFKDTFHWSEQEIGWAMALNGAIVFIVEMPLIFYLEKRKSVLFYVRIGLILYFLSYLMLMLPLAAISMALLFMLFISLGEIMVMPFSGNFAYDRANKRSNKGAYLALYGLAYSIANVLAPLLGTQIIAEWGFNSLWGISLVLAIISLGGFYWLERRIHS